MTNLSKESMSSQGYMLFVLCVFKTNNPSNSLMYKLVSLYNSRLAVMKYRKLGPEWGVKSG